MIAPDDKRLSRVAKTPVTFQRTSGGWKAQTTRYQETERSRNNEFPAFRSLDCEVLSWDGERMTLDLANVLALNQIVAVLSGGLGHHVHMIYLTSF